MCIDDSSNNGNRTNAVGEEESMQEGDGDGNLENLVTVAVPFRSVPYDDSDPSVSNRATKPVLLSASKAEEIAKSFSSSLPSFQRVMKSFNISGSYTLNIPYQFAKHLPDCKLKIVLRNLKGESWTVNSIPTTKKTNVTYFLWRMVEFCT